MTTVLRDEIRTARKAYHCDAFARWRDCAMGPQDCENDEQRATLAAAEADGGKILPGQKYRFVAAIYDGDFGTWRERIDMGKLCAAHDLYDEY
jgi:hypothetical protein